MNHHSVHLLTWTFVYLVSADAHWISVTHLTVREREREAEGGRERERVQG